MLRGILKSMIHAVIRQCSPKSTIARPDEPVG
jgi:hypothetical protein